MTVAHSGLSPRKLPPVRNIFQIRARESPYSPIWDAFSPRGNSALASKYKALPQSTLTINKRCFFMMVIGCFGLYHLLRKFLLLHFSREGGGVATRVPDGGNFNGIISNVVNEFVKRSRYDTAIQPRPMSQQWFYWPKMRMFL